MACEECDGCTYTLCAVANEDLARTFWFSPRGGDPATAFSVVDTWDVLEVSGELVLEGAVPPQVAEQFPDETDLWKATVTADGAALGTISNGRDKKGTWRLRIHDVSALSGPFEIGSEL